MRKLLFSLIPCLLALSLLPGCQSAGGSQSSLDPGLSDTTITLGTWGPQTGPAALWGTIQLGMDAYMQQVNAQGGIHGRKINLIIKDDAYDPSRTVPAVRELVQRDEIFAALGTIGTANNLAVEDFILENQIPWIFPLTGSHVWSYPPRRSIFAILPLYFDEADVLTNYALDSLKMTKIGILYQNDDFGKSGVIGARKTLDDRNLKLVSEVSVELTDTDLSTQIARLKDAGAEAVLLFVAPRQAAIALGTAGALGFTTQWMASTVLSDMNLMVDVTKGAWEGVLFNFPGTMPYDTTNIDVQRYQQALKTFYPEVRWGVFPYTGMVYADILTQALQAAGPDLTREKLIDAMENLEPKSFAFNYPKLGPDNRLFSRSFYIIRCLGPSQFETVTDLITSKTDIGVLAREMEAQ